jgi:hypothetical protein
VNDIPATILAYAKACNPVSPQGIIGELQRQSLHWDKLGSFDQGIELAKALNELVRSSQLVLDLDDDGTVWFDLPS